LDRWFGQGDALYGEVSSGLPNSQTVAEAQAIWELSQRIRRAGPEVIERVRASTWEQLKAGAGDGPALRPIVDQFAAFLRNHRHRGAAYKELVFKRWGDDPDLLLTLLVSTVDSTADDPVTQNAAQQRQRQKRQRELLRRVRYRPIRRIV